MKLRGREDIIAIEFERNGQEYTISGEFISQDDDSVMIKGQVGDKIIVPKSRIVMITLIGKKEYDETPEDFRQL